MASTASPSLKLELMGTGDQSGTWGTTTNTNLGTLLEQAITGYEAIAKVGTGDLTLTNTDYVANQTRNALIEITGTPGGAFNVVVPLAEKLWVFKNSSNGAMTVKGASGTTVTVAVGASAWLFCDGTNVRDALGYYFTSTSTAFSPATTDGQALGTTALMWSDLFLASGAVVNWNNGDVLLTHSSNALAFTGASSGYSFDAAVLPSANDAAALGSATVSFADLFLASGGVINFNNGDVLVTHSSNTLAFTGASSGYTFDANVATTGTFTKNGNDVTVGTVTFIIDGGGATITTGVKGYLTIPFACTINEWTLLADQSGSIVVDIWKDTYANFPPTVADTITASAKPTITTATKGQSSTLTGWTTTIAAGDILAFNVDSITTCQRVTLSLKVTRS